MLSEKQLLHRQYLESPTWQAKRQEALAYYGCICNRCKRHGTDVHHKTYKRWGGKEKMEDLEVLCRECHDTHHSIERATRKHRKKSQTINRVALFNYLTPAQRQRLKIQFNIVQDGELYTAIVVTGQRDICKQALSVVGKKRCIAGPLRSPPKPHYKNRKNKPNWIKI